MAPEQQFKLPAWLQEGLDGDPTDTLLNKRTDERHNYSILANLQEETDGGWGEPRSAKVFNVSTTGMGLVVRQAISLGRNVRIAPLGDPQGEPGSNGDESVRGHVVYCKQTIQGFKVGCEFTPPQ